MTAKITLHIPTREYIDSLKVGDMALDRFGKYAQVKEINYQDIRVSDNARFIGVSLAFGENGSTITQSYVENELIRTVALSKHFASHQIDDIEQQMKRQDIEVIECSVDEIWNKFIWNKLMVF